MNLTIQTITEASVTRQINKLYHDNNPFINLHSHCQQNNHHTDRQPKRPEESRLAQTSCERISLKKYELLQPLLQRLPDLGVLDQHRS